MNEDTRTIKFKDEPRPLTHREVWYKYVQPSKRGREYRLDASTIGNRAALYERIDKAARLVSLRLVLDGQLDSLAVASDGEHRVVAPYPVTLKNGHAHIRAKAGARYQIVVDGERVVDVESEGDDVVALR